MLPLQIQRRLANPSKLERDFMNFLELANAPVDQSKTIAESVLYDAKLVTGQSRVSFFTGEFDPALSNLEGSYIRPSSEHFLIYGIIGYFTPKGIEGTDVGNKKFKWTKGFNSSDINEDQSPGSPFQYFNVSVTVNSVQLLKNVPSQDFDSEVKISSESGGLLLNQPILWQGETQLELTITTADPSLTFPGVPGEEEFFIRFDLLGLQLI